MEINWGTIIPLIGGMAVGNAKAFNSNPKWAAGFPGFENNNKHFREYFSGVPFHLLADDGLIPDLSNLEKVDVVTTVCPCAGLSMLNSSGMGDKARGCNAMQNGWLYLTSEAVLSHVKPKVLMGENAPGLFTGAGEDVRCKLFDIACKHGYSLSFMKTNTILHGIPQSRVRTFYFFWKSETPPILNYYDEELPNIIDYLSHIPDWANNQIEIAPNLFTNTTIEYVKNREGNNWRSALTVGNRRHVWDYIVAWDLFDDFINFCESQNNPKADKYASKAVNIRDKLSINTETGKPYGGFWNDSVMCYGPNTMNAVIGKNVYQTLHPLEDRSFTIRELLWLMGHPHDFDLIDNKHVYTIFQNVPSSTAASWSNEIVKFLQGELPFHDEEYLMQNNLKKTIL